MALSTTAILDFCRACTRYSGLRLLPCLGSQQQRGAKKLNVSQKRLSDAVLQGLEPKPKRPVTAYLSWYLDNRQRLLSVVQSTAGGRELDWKKKVAQVAAVGAEEWRSLNTDEKQLYREQCKALYDQYSADIQSYMSKLSPEQRQVLKNRPLLKRKHSIKLQADKMAEKLGKPRRPRSAFLLYVKDNDGPRSGTGDLTDFMRECGDRWQMMSREDKGRYKERTKVLMEEYKESLAAWEAKMRKKGNFHLVRRGFLRKAEKVAADAILHPSKKPEPPKKKDTKKSSKSTKKSSESKKKKVPTATLR